jgi:hypothetical protein
MGSGILRGGDASEGSADARPSFFFRKAIQRGTPGFS